MGFSLILRAFFSFPNERQFIECQFFWEFRDLASELFVMLTENLIGFVPDNYFPEEYRGQLRRIPIENGHHQFRLELKYLPGENPAVPLFVKELSNYLKNQ